jgi:predicted ATPase with chaperone activity
MLAHQLTTLLPAMTLAEAIETMRIHRVAGRTVRIPMAPGHGPH